MPTPPVAELGVVRRCYASPVNEDQIARRIAWKAEQRAELRRPKTWIVFGALYVVAYLLVFATTTVLNWIAPHLPWLSKPYVDHDPPPTITAFYCANTVAAALPIGWIIGYYIYDPNKKRNDRNA